MKGLLFSITASLLVLGILVAPAACETEEVAILVSPSTFNLASESTCVTVHAEFPHVDGTSAELTIEDQSPISADFTFSDSRGEVVAKFDVAAVKAALRIELGDKRQVTVTVVVNGESAVGSFSGSDSVRVIDEDGNRR